MEYKITATIVSMTEGLKKYDNIRMIRIKSKHHTLLIMEDYMPVIGELDGMVEIVIGDRTVIINDIRGFYMHKRNEFNLLVRDGKALLTDKEDTEANESKEEIISDGTGNN